MDLQHGKISQPKAEVFSVTVEKQFKGEGNRDAPVLIAPKVRKNGLMSICRQTPGIQPLPKILKPFGCPVCTFA
jgi:hypothetical protein